MTTWSRDWLRLRDARSNAGEEVRRALRELHAAGRSFGRRGTLRLARRLRKQLAADNPAPQRRLLTMPNASDRPQAQLVAEGRPLRELMFQLWLGRTRRSWLVATRRSLAPLFDDIHWMCIPGAFELLHHFDMVLKSSVGVGRLYVEAGTVAEIRATYTDLNQLLPAVFPAESDHDPRRATVFEAALLRADGAGTQTLAALRAARLTSFERLREPATPAALCARTHLAPEIAAALIERLREFDGERETRDPKDLRTQGARRLRALYVRLTAIAAEARAAQPHLSSAHGASPEELRATLPELELDQLLAEVGELELATELRGLSLTGKIERIAPQLNAWLP